MCLIVDASLGAELLGKASAVTDWLLRPMGKPRLVVSGKLMEELARIESVRLRLVALSRAGRLRPVEADRLRAESVRLENGGLLASNDSHVIALAILSGARTLATDDKALARDFRDKRLIDKPRGSVYRDGRKHKHLLRHTPQSCGFR